MHDQTPAFVYFLAPFVPVWGAFVAFETRKIVAAIRGGRQ
jgi:hypothetical protein